MTLPANLPTLLDKLSSREALIVDDAYDKVPTAESMEGVDLNKVVDALPRVTAKVRKELEGVLLAEGFDVDEFREGFGTDKFVGVVWRLYGEGKLKGKIYEQLFATFKVEQENKRTDLKDLIKVLRDDLGFTIKTQGSGTSSLTGTPQLILLDLYLSFKDHQKAVDNSVARIERMLQDKPETNRPFIIVMSSKGEKLSSTGMELKEKAGLMGSKFRTLAKAEASTVLASQLEDMLLGLEDAEIYAEWLTAWRDALEASQKALIKKLRLLDLSDLGYLYKYKLQEEGMPLGTYLRKLGEDHVLYELEGAVSLDAKTKQMNGLKFTEIPTAQYLPSNEIPVLKFTSSFVNEVVVNGNGFQFADAKQELVLGDLLIPKPKGWESGQNPRLADGTEVLVVLSQACDILQCKTDTFLFLRGVIQDRRWSDDVADSTSGTDVFYFKDQKLRINWQKAKITAWNVNQTNIRLSPKNGRYLRIARLREVEALRLQNLFSSNLTRVGLFASPYQHWNVGVRIKVPLTAGGHATVVDIPQSEAPAAVIETKATRKVVVFDPGFRQQFVEKCEAFDWTLVKAPLPTQFRALYQSPELLKTFVQEHPAKTITAGALSMKVTWKDEPHQSLATVELLSSDSAS